MDDLIRRSDAIEAIEVVDWYHQNRNKDMVSGANSDEHQAWYKADDVYKALEAVPSADRPSGEWIPTSVRTPKDNRAVLVYEKNYRNIYTAYYHSVYGWMTFDPYSNECFGEHLDIIAWMPLPKPWKGADDE